MRIFLACIGRERPGPTRSLFDAYVARLPWDLELRELEEKKPLPAERRRAREGELLLGALPKSSFVVALDERGKMPDSTEFARLVSTWFRTGDGTISFLVGGADGHADAVRARADYLLSFGRMTWPHMLVRGLLAEQLYRAASINSGHPYHRA